MFVVELFDNGSDCLFVFVVGGFIGIEKFVEPLARVYEFNTGFFALFPVLLVLGLLVVAFGRFRGIIYSVYFVAILFRYNFGFFVFSFFRKL